MFLTTTSVSLGVAAHVDSERKTPGDGRANSKVQGPLLVSMASVRAGAGTPTYVAYTASNRWAKRGSRRNTLTLTASLNDSPAALGDTERATGDATYYRALVCAEPSTVRSRGKPLLVMRGMPGSVEVRTGERSVMSYLLRPMLKSKEAFQDG